MVADEGGVDTGDEDGVGEGEGEVEADEEQAAAEEARQASDRASGSRVRRDVDDALKVCKLDKAEKLNANDGFAGELELEEFGCAFENAEDAGSKLAGVTTPEPNPAEPAEMGR